MIKLKDLLLERIVLDINVGDVILVGKFKNKKMVVKTIGKDKHGMPTINGRKATTFRIAPKSNLKYEVNERVDFHQMATELVKNARLNSKINFKNTGDNKADYNVDKDIINIKPTSNLKDFLVTVFHELDHARDAKRYGKEKYKEKYEQEMNKAVDKGRDAHDGNYFEKKAEKYGREMARKFLKKR
jgi:hypothetical protein